MALSSSSSSSSATTLDRSHNRNRKPTMRSVSSTISDLSSASSNELSSDTIDERIKTMAERAKNGTPMTEDEIEDICNGLRNLAPIVDGDGDGNGNGNGNQKNANNNNNNNASIDFDGLRTLLAEVAHLSHKDWAVTSENSDKLCERLSVESTVAPPTSAVSSSTTTSTSTSTTPTSTDFPLSASARQLLERVVNEGNWDGAVDCASRSDRPSDEKSWAVLVTGVNGIRKTTSMYQPWFAELLSEALVCPDPDTTEGEEGKGKGSSKSSSSSTATTIPSPGVLPTGSNSFFRQLDHMICTLCNEEFTRLYAWSTKQLPKTNDDDDDEKSVPSDDVVDQYSNYKAAIFGRYRTLSELLGALLLKQAQKVNINCMMETSGRDVAMFHYVDHFFGNNPGYNKLALHFTINDLACAKTSVDRRMIDEIRRGAVALDSGDAFDIVYTNQGGPYGSKVLEGVQSDSERVWETEVLSGAVGKDWYKATIAIHAHETESWTARAVRPDGSLGTVFTFAPRN
eukprot:jgi/Psemu1/230933/e_gw1.3528.2.1